MIALLDYGAGNVRSVQKALTAAGGEVRLVSDPEAVRRADAVVLPGVGAFDDCVNAMQRQELFGAAKDFIGTGKPFLGICVGMQSMMSHSEENNGVDCLDIFTGNVQLFDDGLVDGRGEKLKVPHMPYLPKGQASLLRQSGILLPELI